MTQDANLGKSTVIKLGEPSDAGQDNAANLYVRPLLRGFLKTRAEPRPVS